MKKIFNLKRRLIILFAILWISAQSFSAKKHSFAPPTNIQVEAGDNAVAVTWEASADEAESYFAGYTIYFDTKSSAQLAPDQIPNSINVKKNVHEHVIKGLVNDQQYFVQVCSYSNDGASSATDLAEKVTTPQSEGQVYTIHMFDYDIATASNNSGYGWNRSNGQDIPGHHSLMQYVKYIDILMMKSPTSSSNSVFISPSAADLAKNWPVRNKTRIADIGTNWNVDESLPETAFTTTAVIKKGHVYVIKTFDDYHVKIHIKSIEQVNLLLPYGSERSNVDLNKITFTYASQLGQSYEDFMTGSFLSAP